MKTKTKRNEEKLKDSSIKLAKRTSKSYNKQIKANEEIDEAQMQLNIAEVKKYLAERRSKHKSGAREDEGAYLEASKDILEEDHKLL